MAKPKKVSFEILARDSVIGHPIYELLDELIESHRPEHRRTQFALGWCTSWKADVDGNITLGKCVKASDLSRELAPYDFVILLARWYWRDERTTDLHRRKLLHHELLHAEIVHDKHGEPIEDERGRRVYRIRKHDYEQFFEIVECYGLDTGDQEQQLAKAIRLNPPEFKGCPMCVDGIKPGWIQTTDLAGVTRMSRCSCWTEFQQIREEIPA